jgi:GAF domain-containing protein
MESLAFFSQMALDLHDAPTAESTIERIAEYAKLAIGCDDAGIMLVHARNQIETAAATSQRVAESHSLQIIHDEGPCLDAIDGNDHYLSDDVRVDPRWAKWGPAVAELGLRSALSLRLETRSRRYGSLNLQDDVAVATIFVRHAAIAIANAHSEEGLQVAIDARKLIGQAQGILMERFDIEADRAFEFLRRQSQTHNVKLRYVAEWVVEHRDSPDATFSAPAEQDASVS